MKIINKISNIGIYQGMPFIDQKYVNITNYINLINIFFVCIPLIVLTIFFLEDGFKSYSRYIVWIGLSLTSILLNSYHKFILSKVLTYFSSIFCLIIFPIFITHFIHERMFLWIPYAIIIFGSSSFLVYSYEKEKEIMITMILISAILIIFLDEILMILFNDKIDLSFIKANYITYTFSKIFSALFLYTTFFIFKYWHFKNRMEMNLLGQIVHEQNKELALLNTKLESIVEERTQKLQLQNLRIKNLAFTNSHEIRAYIARIIGLVDVKSYGVTEDEKVFCDNQIKVNAIELDELTKRIAKELIEEKE